LGVGGVRQVPKQRETEGGGADAVAPVVPPTRVGGMHSHGDTTECALSAATAATTTAAHVAPALSARGRLPPLEREASVGYVYARSSGNRLRTAGATAAPTRWENPFWTLSRSLSRVARRNVRSFVPHGVRWWARFEPRQTVRWGLGGGRRASAGSRAATGYRASCVAQAPQRLSASRARCGRATTAAARGVPL